MAKTVLILGGVRSGKSEFAKQIAAKLGGDDVLFVATAQRGDDEMTQRIERHQQSRPAAWSLLESSDNIGATLQAYEETPAAIIVDCLTLLVSNVVLAGGETIQAEKAEQKVEREIDSLLAACRELSGTVILVSGEVGMGIVPSTPLGRMFRDILGLVNRRIAEVADATYLMIAGRPVELNSIATTIDDTIGKLKSS